MPYIAKANTWYPPDAIETLEGARRCCVGVSVGQPAFRGRRLKSLVHWLRTHADSVLFLIGDHILRNTIQIEMGTGSEKTAALLAEQRGRLQAEVVAEATRVGGLRAEILSISSLISTPEYRRSLAWVQHMKICDSAFSDSLHGTAERYLASYISQGRSIAGDDKDALCLCTRYLEEELAAFSVIHEQGWRIDVYPGPELPVLLELAQGKYVATPAALRSRISISLAFTRLPSAPPTISEAHCVVLQPAC